MATDKRYDNTKQWYVIHTYSGYEEKVAAALRERAASLEITNQILEVLVPKEKQIEIKNGKRRVVEKRIFQGYVLVRMKLSEEAWFVVRNTPHVTGFVDSGSGPTPISQDEIDKILKRMGVDQPKHSIDYKVGDVVQIIDGPFRDQEGSVSEVDSQKGKIKVLVSMFGRDTPVELDSLQVKQP